MSFDQTNLPSKQGDHDHSLSSMPEYQGFSLSSRKKRRIKLLTPENLKKLV